MKTILILSSPLVLLALYVAMIRYNKKYNINRQTRPDLF